MTENPPVSVLRILPINLANSSSVKITFKTEHHPILRLHQGERMNILILLNLSKEPACQCKGPKRYEFDPWVRKIPWRRIWQPTPGLLPGESHGQKSLVGYSPWGPTESATTEAIQWALKPWTNFSYYSAITKVECPFLEQLVWRKIAFFKSQKRSFPCLKHTHPFLYNWINQNALLKGGDKRNEW